MDENYRNNDFDDNESLSVDTTDDSNDSKSKRHGLTENKLKWLIKVVLFISLIAIIVQLFPTETKFKYHFEVGKPWNYELVTASFNFPVYKDERVLEQERQLLLESFVPYYVLDTTVFLSQKNKLNEAIQQTADINASDAKNLVKALNEVYNNGIIALQDIDELKLKKMSEVKCIYPNRITRTLNIEKLFTARSAYEHIISKVPEASKLLDINLYLSENLKFDSITTSLSRDELLSGLSYTEGMIQAGERIVDRGEIINTKTFQILNSLKLEYDKRNATVNQSTIVIVGEIIIITGLIFLFFLYLYLFRPRIFDKFSHLLFISLVIAIMVGITSLIVRVTSLNYNIVPYALLPIIIRVFFDSRTALFAHIITTMIISFMVDNSAQFMLLQIAVGMAAVSSLKDMTQRSQLAQSAFYIFLTYAFAFLAYELIIEGDIARVHWDTLLYFGISSAFLLFAYVLIYIFEKMFGLISSVTLVELTNVNNDLMMRFAEVAPGTFQHTLQVSNLATEAAKKIGANSLLVRTGALYHDIGKMKNPQFFTENQMGGYNPLSEMSFEDAAKVIINHVKDGVEIAKKNHLPDQIINFIVTHHGKSKTKYFYNSFVNANPDVLPDESLYTYPGPLPNSKETAILMMADAVEARSRSLQVYNETTISDAVEQMINTQIADGQFKDAPISFRDVETVKSVFKEKIKNIYHSRISYPELKKTK